MHKTLVGLPDYHQLTGNWPGEGPAYIMMNLPTRCSLRCPKCALEEETKRAGPPLSNEEREQVLAQAATVGILTLVVIGMGEPTEHPEVMFPTIKAAHTNGMSSIVFTTHNRLNREQAEFYAEHGTSMVMSLDSLNARTYRELTGGGDLKRVLGNLAIAREVYGRRNDYARMHGEHRACRLGMNVTVTEQNRHELSALHALAGDDLFFVANPPMPHGNLERPRLWDKLVRPSALVRTKRETSDSFGSEWESLRVEAEAHSDTGGHSSLTAGLCGYFSRGVSVHVDGEWLGPCAYGTESAGRLGNARGATPSDVLRQYERVRAAFSRFGTEIGRTPSCPLRDPAFPRLINLL